MAECGDMLPLFSACSRELEAGRLFLDSSGLSGLPLGVCLKPKLGSSIIFDIIKSDTVEL